MSLPESNDELFRQVAEQTANGLSIRDAASTTNLLAFQNQLGTEIGLNIIRDVERNPQTVVTIFGPPGSGKTTWATALAVATRQILKIYKSNLLIDYVYYDRTHALRELQLGRSDTTFKDKSDWATSQLMIAQIEQLLLYRKPLPKSSRHLILVEFVNLQRNTEERGETIVPSVVRIPGVSSHHVAFVPNPVIQEITKRQRETIASMETVTNVNLFLLMMKGIGLDLSFSVTKDNLQQKQALLKTIVSKMGNAQAIASLTALLAKETNDYISQCNQLPPKQISLLHQQREQIIKRLPSEIARDYDNRIKIANMMLYWLDLFSQWNVPYERGHVLVGNTLAQALIPSLLEEIGPLYGGNA